ncbi:hypothetical protein SLEP1_g35086 [Rubroshorea leprosula]|uniref:Uncharacterized protein n=1 Tax=Rubroshorea leprosula TaxID=152421 RepID=A0AAV5KM56_9ROSI|nr:hypothetical protein SLEP1_g35086 [Rubroshorea leprosula]
MLVLNVYFRLFYGEYVFQDFVDLIRGHTYVFFHYDYYNDPDGIFLEATGQS